MNIKLETFRYKFRVQVSKCSVEMLKIMKDEIARQQQILNKKNRTK